MSVEELLEKCKKQLPGKSFSPLSQPNKVWYFETNFMVVRVFDGEETENYNYTLAINEKNICLLIDGYDEEYTISGISHNPRDGNLVLTVEEQYPRLAFPLLQVA